MLFNISYRNEEYIKESVKLVGKSFSLFERIKIRGIGSRRFVISELSSKLKPQNMIRTSDIQYANIELRPKGIIIHFANLLDRYAWVVPFYKIAFYSTKSFSIHADGNFIQFKKNNNYRENKNFIRKIMMFKNDILNETQY